MLVRYENCRNCDAILIQPKVGRKRVYCNNTCRYAFLYSSDPNFRDNEILRKLDLYYNDRDGENVKRCDRRRKSDGKKNKVHKEQELREIWDKPGEYKPIENPIEDWTPSFNFSIKDEDKDIKFDFGSSEFKTPEEIIREKKTKKK